VTRDDTVKLTAYKFDDEAGFGRYVDTGETVSVHQLSHCLNHEQLANLLGDWANAGGKSFVDGQKVGRQLHWEHRHLQHCVVWILLGILREMAQQTAWDARNEYALRVCRQLVRYLQDEADVYMGHDLKEGD